MKTKDFQSLLIGLLSLGAVVSSSLPGLAQPGTISIEASVRAEASLQAQVLDGLPVGTPVEVLRVVYEPSRGDHWYYLTSKGSLKTRGWVRSDLINLRSDGKTYGVLGEPTQQLDDVVNLRSGPGLRHQIAHTGIMGDLVEMGGVSRRDHAGYRWNYITYPNGSWGWVREDLIQKWPKYKMCLVNCARR
jgi:Bacterial SH3 domain